MMVISFKFFETLLEARLFGRSFVSLCCGLYGEKGMLGFSRYLEDIRDDVGLASFLYFFLDLQY